MEEFIYPTKKRIVLLSIDEKIKQKKNVVYKITLRGYEEVCYIGQTARPLIQRTKEHINNWKDPVNKYIMYHDDIVAVSVTILRECKQIDLYNAETIEIGKHILKCGTVENPTKNLLNKDLKGLQELTFEEIEKKIEKLNLSIDN